MSIVFEERPSDSPYLDGFIAGAGYTTVEQLADVSEARIKELHGIGPSALEVLRQALANQGLSFTNHV